MPPSSSPSSTANGQLSFVRVGGYQIRLGSGLIEYVLELCLSHHDELRSTAVQVLFSLIVNEWSLSQSFGTIQSDVIDRLDKLFSSRRRDEVR